MILDEIAAATRLRVEQLQRIKDLNKINTNSDVLKETKDVKVVGAVYNLTNSKVEFLKK